MLKILCEKALNVFQGVGGHFLKISGDSEKFLEVTKTVTKFEYYMYF